MKNNNGYMNRLVQAATKNKESHFGYDIQLKDSTVNAMQSKRRKPSDGTNITDWVLVNQGIPLTHSKVLDTVVASKLINKLLDMVLSRSKKAAEENNNNDEVETKTTMINGKILRSISGHSDGTYTCEVNMETTPEIEKTICNAVSAYQVLVMKYQSHIMQLKNRMRIDTYDCSTTDELVINTASGVVPVIDKTISADKLKASLYFLMDLYMDDPAFVKLTAITLCVDKYTAHFKNKQFHIDHDGLSQLEIDVFNDLVTVEAKKPQ